MKRICTQTMFSRVVIAIAMVAGVLLLSSVAEACPSCKAALEDEAGGGNLIKGYFWSIMFMMSAPFAILGCFSGYMYHEVRKARRNREAVEGDSDRRDL